MSWWLAGLAMVGAVALTYRLVRPPELVWWTSRPLDAKGRHARLLIPAGWKLTSRGDLEYPVLYYLYFEPAPLNYPRWLNWLSRPVEKGAALNIYFDLRQQHPGSGRSEGFHADVITQNGRTGCRSDAGLTTTDGHVSISYLYFRSDQAAFYRTQAEIAKSLRIE